MLDLAETTEPKDLADHDFWLMDNHLVLIMHYDENGRFHGASVAGDQELGRYQRAAEAAWQAAVPFGEYWTAHPQFWRHRA